MITEIITPTLETSQSIINEAKKIVKEKKPEEYTEADEIIIQTAYKLCKLIKGMKR